LGQLLDNLDLKIGRQIVVWGKSDTIRVTDVLNPLDMREPGMTDIEDLRLPVSMTKLDYYLADWKLSGMALHEVRFNKIPAYGHDFYQADGPLPPEDEPDRSEWAFSLGGIFNGWDVDLYYARVFNDRTHLEVGWNGTTPEPRLQHERLHMFGFAYNRALGNWLAKTEAALLDGIEYSNTPGENYSRFDALIGLEYTGFPESSISLEFANRHINDYDAALEAAPDGVIEDMFQASLSYNRDFLNDTLSLTFLATIFGPSSADGAFERLSLEYDLSDTVLLRGGAVLYQSGDLLNMQDISHNDRLFLEIRYSF
ncbi:MAG: ligand-binding protein SH3, partial [Candidatus Electrothrix sp. AR3]|nr:ligand-binding protein SH3 [Candidatus Electrothrix sp. AR3]